MKKLFLLLCTVCLSALWGITASCSSNSTEGKTVEITFDYVKKAGPGSNQYAVWIENENNEVVKTLFVTSFTTKGRIREGEPIKRGYTYRPACVPTWVTNAKAAEMTDTELDAFTGATPKESGKQTFTWDFTDNEGKRVANGAYKVFVEATLKNECRIQFSGTVSTKAKKGEVAMNVIETGSDEQYAGMVKDVKIMVK